MKNALYLLLVCALLNACGSKPKPDTLAENKALLASIKLEPMVLDVALSQFNILYVSVKDDGTSRKGLAQYFCELAKQHKSTVENVRVIKAFSASKENGLGVLLGECYCK